MSKYLLGELLPNLLVAVLTFLAFYVLWIMLKRAIAVLERTDLDETARAFILQVVKYAVFTIGVVSALGQLGVNTASLLTSLGVAGLTLGFAARDTLSNLISGLFIFWDRPFVVGDLIEIGGQYGRVKEITMRSTRVVTNDGRMLAIPNSQIVNSTVASYTNFPNLRIEIDFTVAVTEDLGRIRELLLDLIHDDERFLDEPRPDVVVTQLNDYNVAMAFRAWLEDERKHIPVRFEMRQKVFETLRDAGVDMPYETLQLAPMTVETRPAKAA
jgi:small conductance mechanosensitive channel